MKVKLKKEGYVPNTKEHLPSGTQLYIHSARSRREKIGDKTPPVVQFLKDGDWVETSPEDPIEQMKWEDVESPRECIKNAVQRFGGVQVAYCATHDDFVDLDWKHPEVKFCPLCGKKYKEDN